MNKKRNPRTQKQIKKKHLQNPQTQQSSKPKDNRMFGVSVAQRANNVS